MKAIQIERFGTPEVIRCVDTDVPAPKEGEVLVRVRAAGVGPWDALIRRGGSALVGKDLLPVTLGSDIAGHVHAVGPGHPPFAAGDEIYGVTNSRFIGGYAEFAIASSGMIAKKPASSSFAEAASVPVVAVTAWQMLFDHAKLERGQVALILGASGNVGGYAVQLAAAHGIRVIARGAAEDSQRLAGLGAERIVDTRDASSELEGLEVDAVIDTVGGELQARSFASLKRGGVLVSAVSAPDVALSTKAGVRSLFFYVEVTTESLDNIARLVDAKTITPRVGIVLPLSDARIAHEMLEGTRKAPRGKIVLSVEG